jgi:biopolymer transport protein ExbD
VSLKTIPLDEPGINLTSMLDVVMLLIMFFMAGTQFKDDEKQYDITLPAVHDASPVATEQPDEIVVNVQQDGRITVRTDEKSVEQLEVLLIEARTRFPGQGVIVRGDANVPYRHVMAAMGAARRAGIRNVSLAYQPGEPPQ